jgi:hypothetical protein
MLIEIGVIKYQLSIFKGLYCKLATPIPIFNSDTILNNTNGKNNQPPASFPGYANKKQPAMIKPIAVIGGIETENEDLL